MKTNRVVIIQCRLSSTRLPGKALLDLNGKPIFAWCLRSMKKVKADKYFVATDEDSFSKLEPICKEYGYDIFAGDLQNVLKRFVDLLNTIECKTVIRATADNPFLFYEAAQESVELFEEKNQGKNHCDYLTYTGLPHGSGVEVFSSDSLKKAFTLTTDPYDTEHVGPALYNHKEHFICDFVSSPKRFNYPHLRTTIDTYSDYLRAISVTNYLEKSDEPYTTEQIIEALSSKKVQYPVILVPSVVKGHGTGHLRRCLTLATQTNFFIYIPEDKTLDETDSLITEYSKNGLKSSQIISALPDETYLPVIITDTFELTIIQIKELAKNRSFISIDEGSAFSDYCDYLLDIIPSVKSLRIPNKFDSSLIEKPKNSKNSKTDTLMTDTNGTQKKDTLMTDTSGTKIENILVCFGGEDPAGFTIPTVKALSLNNPNAKITAIITNPPSQSFSQNVEFVKPIENLREKLYEYDLVVTHYGLTAFEAVYAGCGVILMPTTKLHVQLAHKYNFAYIKNTDVSHHSFSKALSSPNLYTKLPVSEEFNSLGDFLQKVSNGRKLLCPICGESKEYPDRIVARNSFRTYRRCKNCDIVYMAFTLENEKQYSSSYFFEDYKKQYGKTYEEDFESIKKTGLKRVSHIQNVFGTLEGKSILDIGCAYGPFLSAALEYKMNVFGTDISQEAVDSVSQKLKIPAVCSSYPQINTDEEFGIQQFDVVTMWYVIEHFTDLDKVLRKTSSIVKKGGIFAFSTPSGEGISASSDKNHFYEISPSDHYTVWEPSKANKLLKKYGFKVVKIVSTGHHPERFPSIKKRIADGTTDVSHQSDFAKKGTIDVSHQECHQQTTNVSHSSAKVKKGSFWWKTIDIVSHIKKLGDTVEIYCKKI